MKSKILLATLIIITIISCRRKASDDYQYYKPYVRDSIAEADSIKTVPVEDTVEAVSTPEPEIKGVDLNDQFFIVVASFAVEEYAIARKNDLESQGYKPEIFMVNGDGWYKLAVESYSTYDEAKAALKGVRDRGGIFGSAVIVSKKSK